MVFLKKIRKNKRLYNFISLLLIYLTLILFLLITSKIINISNVNNPITNNTNLNLKNNFSTNLNNHITPSPSKINIPNNNINFPKSNILSPKNLYNNFPLDSQDIVNQVNELPVPLNNIYDIDYNI
tara:strand:+ start:49 stop:426 length:378 start_codon:yes stop_codon:yes gene_type:complete